jgi:hypothetical protein
MGVQVRSLERGRRTSLRVTKRASPDVKGGIAAHPRSPIGVAE